MGARHPSPAACGYEPRPLTIVARITGQIESNYDETVDSFDEMNLRPELLRGKSVPRPDKQSWRCGAPR